MSDRGGHTTRSAQAGKARLLPLRLIHRISLPLLSQATKKLCCLRQQTSVQHLLLPQESKVKLGSQSPHSGALGAQDCSTGNESTPPAAWSG